MTFAPRSRRSRFPSFLVFLLRSLSLVVVPVAAQDACAATCPPVVGGVEVSSVCEGDSLAGRPEATRSYDTCHPAPVVENLRLADLAGDGRVVVVANHYIGCNAGRRESGVFAHVAQRYHDAYGPDKVTFLVSLKGGADCERWASLFQRDAVTLYNGLSDVVPNEAPLTVLDTDYELRDDLFTTPFPHPSYVILDGDLVVRHKFVGPCCGYESFYDCEPDTARSLDDRLTNFVDAILKEQGTYVDGDSDGGDVVGNVTTAPTAAPHAVVTDDEVLACVEDDDTAYTKWSECSNKCRDDDGAARAVQFRTLVSASNDCADVLAPAQMRDCEDWPDDRYDEAYCDALSSNVCVPEFGSSHGIVTVAEGFDAPRDVAFHPTPGLHLGDYSEGRTFPPVGADNPAEAWVANGGNHSVSIVTAVGTDRQTTLSRRDRGHYHYSINITALSFNSVSDSGRVADRDSFNYWALCNDNRNDYLGTKEANYFMGPTLYNSDPSNRNTVNRLGQQCGPGEPCFFLHADMLHESPACVGIVHDPEVRTAFGNVYWAFDGTGDNATEGVGQLVRFDFQQPHGPGSMDHSIANVRRYPEIELRRGPPGVHAGMAIHAARRELYVANPGDGTVLRVMMDSGTYARTAREEYPIFSNRLPSFEYSVWECAERHTFATGLDTPSGLTLSDDGDRLFVAEHDTGRIHVFETASSARLTTIETGHAGVGGLAFSPSTNELHFVAADTNALYAVRPERTCAPGFAPYVTRVNKAFVAALPDDDASFSLTKNYSCRADPVIPDGSFFDQVHADTGYASNDTTVQANQTGMDANAALLADRTDCEYDGELNFDALLLGGYFCHVCLPHDRGADCDRGGVCTNVQWEGYVCDNEFMVTVNADTGALSATDATGAPLDLGAITLRRGVDYRFTVNGNDDETTTTTTTTTVMLTEGTTAAKVLAEARRGPLLVSTDALAVSTDRVVLRTASSEIEIAVETASTTPTPTPSGNKDLTSSSSSLRVPLHALAAVVVLAVAFVMV